MVGLFSRDNLIPLAIGAGATGLAVPFDDNVERYFAQPEHKAKWLGDFTDQLGKALHPDSDRGRPLRRGPDGP